MEIWIQIIGGPEKAIGHYPVPLDETIIPPFLKRVWNDDGTFAFLYQFIQVVWVKEAKVFQYQYAGNDGNVFPTKEESILREKEREKLYGSN